MGFFMQFYKLPSSIRVKREYANLDHPAHVTITPPDYTMRIDSTYKGWHDAESSIISHELIHVLMNQMGIAGRTTWEDEMFTDAFAVFLGAGLIANFRVSVDFYKDNALVKSMGYLDPRERAYALSRFILESGMEVPSHPQGPWRTSDISGLREAVDRLLLRRQKRKMAKQGSGEYTCPRCVNSLDLKKISPSPENVWCAECGMSWRKGLMGYKCVVC